MYIYLFIYYFEVCLQYNIDEIRNFLNCIPDSINIVTYLLVSSITITFIITIMVTIMIINILLCSR